MELGSQRVVGFGKVGHGPMIVAVETVDGGRY